MVVKLKKMRADQAYMVVERRCPFLVHMEVEVVKPEVWLIIGLANEGEVHSFH
jgi:hypothetical protein